MHPTAGTCGTGLQVVHGWNLRQLRAVTSRSSHCPEGFSWSANPEDPEGHIIEGALAYMVVFLSWYEYFWDKTILQISHEVQWGRWAARPPHAIVNPPTWPLWDPRRDHSLLVDLTTGIRTMSAIWRHQQLPNKYLSLALLPLTDEITWGKNQFCLLRVVTLPQENHPIRFKI